MNDLYLISSIILILILDLALIAARAAYLESAYARLLALRDEFGTALSRTLLLYQSGTRLYNNLSMALVLTRFALAGLVYYGLSSRLAGAPGGWAVLVGLLLAALVTSILEFIIQSWSRREPERTAIRLSGFARAISALFSPLSALTLALIKGERAEESPITVTEDELKTLVDAGQEDGVIEQGERRMIYSIIELGNTLVREIMVPRIDMLALDVETPLSEAADALISSGHSRVPIYQESIDNTLGLLYAKDLLKAWRTEHQLASLSSLLRPAYFVPEAKKVDELLTEMQSQRIHMALVVDEYGGTAGLVTLEDIVEEILGEIRDEYDQAEELPFQRLKNGDLIFQGRVDLDDFNEIMGSSLEKEVAETLGGYVYSRLSHVPVAGEMVKEGPLLLIVEQVNARQIRKIRARWSPPGEGAKTEE